jgi:predicted pyridoxine 5'-phosphate oxidase superfamily flavin-nucleotide-binding protein
MATKLNKTIRDLFADPETTKVLATVDEHGVPHVVVKQSLQVDQDGNLLFLELLESSRTNRNLVRSIWYDRTVAVSIRGTSGASFQIKGKPIKTHITGPVFLKHYQAVRERLGDVGLAAVWIVEPDEVHDESFAARQAKESEKHPTFRHLDRLVR